MTGQHRTGHRLWNIWLMEVLKKDTSRDMTLWLCAERVRNNRKLWEERNMDTHYFPCNHSYLCLSPCLGTNTLCLTFLSSFVLASVCRDRTFNICISSSRVNSLMWPHHWAWLWPQSQKHPKTATCAFSLCSTWFLLPRSSAESHIPLLCYLFLGFISIFVSVLMFICLSESVLFPPILVCLPLARVGSQTAIHRAWVKTDVVLCNSQIYTEGCCSYYIYFNMD